MVPRHMKKDKLPSIAVIQTNKHLKKNLDGFRVNSSYYDGRRDTVHTSMMKAADSLIERSLLTNYIEQERKRVSLLPEGPKTDLEHYLHRLSGPQSCDATLVKIPLDHLEPVNNMKFESTFDASTHVVKLPV